MGGMAGIVGPAMSLRALLALFSISLGDSPSVLTLPAFLSGANAARSRRPLPPSRSLASNWQQWQALNDICGCRPYQPDRTLAATSTLKIPLGIYGWDIGVAIVTATRVALSPAVARRAQTNSEQCLELQPVKSLQYVSLWPEAFFLCWPASVTRLRLLSSRWNSVNGLSSRQVVLSWISG